MRKCENCNQWTDCSDYEGFENKGICGSFEISKTYTNKDDHCEYYEKREKVINEGLL